jgi:hypothetical protein
MARITSQGHTHKSNINDNCLSSGVVKLIALRYKNILHITEHVSKNICFNSRCSVAIQDREQLLEDGQAKIYSKLLTSNFYG